MIYIKAIDIVSLYFCDKLIINMKIKTMLSILSILSLFISFNACTIEGEQICGIWYAQGDYGQMKIEITPWEGKFHGYLLEYNDGKTVTKGAKEDEYIFLTDLVFKNEQYDNGKIYLDPSSKESCDISLTLLDNQSLKASYNCGGKRFVETWSKTGFTPTKMEQKMTAQMPQSNKNKPTTEVKTKTSKSTMTTKKEATKPASNAPQNTKKQGTFYVIGVHQTVTYDNINALEKAVEALWAVTYEDDFSGKLTNISDNENMYVTYSDYDKPKGKMTITIGYKVKDLSNVPTDLKGIKVPTNDFYTYPLSGEASDYEGEGWSQLNELMMYRKVESVDFEVYQFDQNYKVKKASIWIAAK